MTGFLFALAAFSATIAGGLFALRFRAGLHFILAFTAGVLLGVVSFDILPEIFGLAQEQGLGATGAMLALDALAPVLGMASTLLFQVPPSVLILYLGFFAGFLLYIGASDILPEAHSQAGPSAAISLIGI